MTWWCRPSARAWSAQSAALSVRMRGQLDRASASVSVRAAAMNISEQLKTAFSNAGARYPELNRAWIEISFRVGSRLPHSLLSAAIQRDGSVDLGLRCMEDEQLQRMATDQSGSFAFHYQKMISDYWIGGVYETFRLLRERNPGDVSPAFAGILADLELIRMPLEKHELAKDWELEAPLPMMRSPPNNDASDIYVYDPKDNRRAHIMAAGVSPTTGSVMWHGIDVVLKADRWIERRDLADRIVALWKS
jgi:hypothetical protein